MGPAAGRPDAGLDFTCRVTTSASGGSAARGVGTPPPWPALASQVWGCSAAATRNVARLALAFRVRLSSRLLARPRPDWSAKPEGPGALPACLPNCLPNCATAATRNGPLRPGVRFMREAIKPRLTLAAPALPLLILRAGGPESRCPCPSSSSRTGRPARSRQLGIHPEVTPFDRSA